MKGSPWLVWLVFPLLSVSCGTPSESIRDAAPAVNRGKAELQAEGHSLSLRREWDSARVLLERALAIDSAYAPALQDLAELYYDRATESGTQANGPHQERYRAEAFRAYVRLEAAGSHDADTYERLCELSVAQKDSQSFLRYAIRYAELYPYDRQYYNLGLAYFGVCDFQNVIRCQKEAVARFPESDYVGSYYRQMARAYLKVDRDQTAERTLTGGVEAVNRKLEKIKQGGEKGEPNGVSASRLKEDRIAMLQMLRTLHIRYRAPEKQEQVERQLKAAGYSR